MLVLFVIFNGAVNALVSDSIFPKAGGPFGAIFIALNTVSGTRRRLKSRSTGGKRSKLQLDGRILDMITSDLTPSPTMRSTSLLVKSLISVSGAVSGGRDVC